MRIDSTGCSVFINVQQYPVSLKNSLNLGLKDSISGTVTMTHSKWLMHVKRRTVKVAFYSLYTVIVVVCMREIVAFLKLWGRFRLPFLFLTLFINYQ